MRLTRFQVLVIAVAVLGAGFVGASVLAPHSMRWRAKILTLKATGQLPDIEWGELVHMLKPGSGFYLEGLAESRNVYASVTSPFSSAADLEAGRELFRSTCAACHGVDGRGREGAPSLVGRTLKHGDSDWALFRTIRYGIDGTPMRPHEMDRDKMWRLVSYVRSLTSERPPSESPSPAIPETFTVPFAEMRATATAQNDWLTYSGSYQGTRHSALAQIDRRSVARLAPAWIRQFPSPEDRGESTPLVRDGIMFVTANLGRVLALDATTGATIWQYTRAPAPDIRTCCGNVNRGAAILDDRIFIGTLDAHLIALNARTGAVLWDKVVADFREGYTITAAPLAFGELVITGVGGGDYPTQGFLAAYDVKTGEKRWSFKTIPGPGEPGNETWQNDSWRAGGAATWVTGSYDAERDLVIWGTGNPAPDFNASQRPGDNLYSCSVVALHGATGKLAWYYQFTPGDDHDWDSAQVPVLAERQEGGQTRSQVLWANRNGFFYVIDRTTGKLVRATPFAHQTWAERIDANGRPVRAKDSAPSAKGTLVFPGPGGATNWWPPSYDPKTDLFFVPTLERGGVFFSAGANAPKATPGEVFLGSATQGITGLKHYTAVRAIQVATGERKWEYRLPPRETDGEIGGVLSTDGGLVFSADLSTFFALNSDTGERLWSFELGGRVSAAPMTFMAGGRQFVAVTAGQAIVAFTTVGNDST